MNGTYQYVRHKDVQLFIDKGWRVVSDLKGTHHGHWSVVMVAPE